ncbi:MAG: ABC transporter substrate-binding protein [Rubrivivax sp.]
MTTQASRRWISALAVVAALAAAGTAAAQGQRVTFRADWTFKAVHAPVFLALERGYYASNGIQLEFLAGSGSANAVKAVGSKADHFGMADAAVMARAVSEGAPVRGGGDPAIEPDRDRGQGRDQVAEGTRRQDARHDRGHRPRRSCSRCSPRARGSMRRR